MKINCLSCGHKVDLDDAYDDYQGEVKCFVCGAVLLIRTTHGALRSVAVARAARRSTMESFGVAR
jgi:ribosomal protein S27E